MTHEEPGAIPQLDPKYSIDIDDYKINDVTLIERARMLYPGIDPEIFLSANRRATCSIESSDASFGTFNDQEKREITSVLMSIYPTLLQAIDLTDVELQQVGLTRDTYLHTLAIHSFTLPEIVLTITGADKSFPKDFSWLKPSIGTTLEQLQTRFFVDGNQYQITAGLDKSLKQQLSTEELTSIESILAGSVRAIALISKMPENFESAASHQVINRIVLFQVLRMYIAKEVLDPNDALLRRLGKM